jgi:hypothetical protein
MHWVHENQMAFDNAQLGFPSILGCQAICFHTSRGLYGFHDLKTGGQASGMTAAQASDAKLKIFAKWVKDDCFQIGETGIALYGVINRDEQYNPDAADRQRQAPSSCRGADPGAHHFRLEGGRLGRDPHGLRGCRGQAVGRGSVLALDRLERLDGARR